MADWSRRRFLAGGAGLATAAGVAIAPALGGCAGVPGDPLPAWPGAQPARESPFGARSTAEEVTAGLDLAGRTVLVTGVTSGIGRETMRVLALRGAHVIATGRTLARATEACRGVEGRTTPLELELADWDSIRACAFQVRGLGAPLDVLVCNAGVMALQQREQVRGIEKQFAVNHLGHFILVHQLLETLRAAPAGRVVVVGSRAYRSAPEAGIVFDDLGAERHYDPGEAYGQSKLANYLFTRELARRLRGTAVTANALHPGLIVTSIVRNLPDWQRRALELAGGLVAKSVGQGAATSCHVAASPLVEGASGWFFSDCNPVKPAGPHMEDDALAARLWAVSEELTRGWLA